MHEKSPAVAISGRAFLKLLRGLVFHKHESL